MRALLIGIWFLALAPSALPENLVSTNITLPLATVQAAIEAYSQSRTNGTDGIWGRESGSIIGIAGEVGIRFRMCSCTSIPVCYQFQAISVSSNVTRLAVGALYSDRRSELTDGQDEYRESRLRRARGMLSGVMDALQGKP